MFGNKEKKEGLHRLVLIQTVYHALLWILTANSVITPLVIYLEPFVLHALHKNMAMIFFIVNPVTVLVSPA